MDITALPYFTPLAKDYSSRFDSSPIRDFFAIAPHAPHEQMREILDARLVRERGLPLEHRAAVAAAIQGLHESLGPVSQNILRNLDRLKSKDALAVVTGQQAGIFGGPLYTFYKAFTAIELARSLEEQFPGFHFIPIFWIETEDHDLEEIAQTKVLNGDGQVETIRYAPSAFSSETPWKKQAGPLPVEGLSIAQSLEQLQSALAPTSFTAELLEMLRATYVPERSLAHAFAAMLLHYFGEDGLLVIDANSRALKELGKELIRKEIETSPELSDRIILTSERLEGAYHAQVKPRALNLFYISDEGDRLAIEEHSPKSGTERSFFLKGSRKSFVLKELLAELDARPERFSPNVVSRPLYQDSLLPTAAYVAGPGEIAYFAQFKPSYQWANLPMPLIHPRVTVTLVEERLERALKKFRITVEDILSEGHGKNLAIFDAMIASDLAPKFAGAIENVDGILESLREAVRHADATLDGALTSLKGKVLTTMRDFEHKTIAAERKRHAATKAQLDKLLSALLPGGELQERELSLVYFLNKYGPDFLKTLKELLRPIALDFREHHIIHLSTQIPVLNDGEAEARTSRASERLSAPAN